MMPFVNNTQQIVLNDTCDISARMLMGDNLVAAPNKVCLSVTIGYTDYIVCPQIEQIRVNFARQAKRINMQKLKSSMWTIITEKQPDRVVQVRISNKVLVLCGCSQIDISPCS